MTTYSEELGAGGHLVSEANGARSRETGVVLAGQDLKAGHVVAVDGDGKYLELAPAASDGTEDAVGILYDAVHAVDDAGDNADTEGLVHVRDCEVNDAELTWPDGITPTQKDTAISQLAAAGIIVR